MFKLSTFILYVRAYLIHLRTGKEITHVFYFSKKQDEVGYGWIARNDNIKSPRTCTFRGVPYSEMRELKYGWSNWEDARIVGFGSDNDVVFI
jgi:hypothetical protein